MSGVAASERRPSDGAGGDARPGLGSRERLLIAAATLGGVAIMALVWLLAGGGGSDKSERASNTPVKQASAVIDRRLGVQAAYPVTWTAAHGKARTLRLTSPGNAVTVAIASPSAGRFPAQVRAATERSIVGAFSPATVVGHSPGRISGLPVRTTEIAGRDRAGHPVRILSIVTATRWRTYAVTVVSAAPPPAARLIEARGILRSVTFHRPASK